MLEHIWHLNFKNLFKGESFALDSNNGLQILLFPFSLATLHSAIADEPSKEEPRHFLIYHYITRLRIHAFT